MGDLFRPPIKFENVLENPSLVRTLIEKNGPYYPVQRYFSNAAQYRALAGSEDSPILIAPNFRGDWAYEEPLIEGIEPILYHKGFQQGAVELFDAEIVQPFSVYANITWQLPFSQGNGHTDVPEFRGINRTEYPTPLLSVMGHSRLFEAERISIATAVAWFYKGVDGGFTYWPQGPTAQPKVHEGEIYNTALEADNERMFHRVRPVGSRKGGMLTELTLDSHLAYQREDIWKIVDRDQTLAEMRWSDLRISLSWKARVFPDRAALDEYEDHSNDLTIEDVFMRFAQNLDQKGIAFPDTPDPIHDGELMDVLARAYMRTPSEFDSVPA